MEVIDNAKTETRKTKTENNKRVVGELAEVVQH